MKREVTHFKKSKSDPSKSEVTITTHPNWFFKLLGYKPTDQWVLGEYWEWRYFPSGIETDMETRRFINRTTEEITAKREFDILASQNKEKMNDYWTPGQK